MRGNDWGASSSRDPDWHEIGVGVIYGLIGVGTVLILWAMSH